VAVVASSAASATGSNSNNQAQSKRAPLPHKFHEIVAQAATTTTGGTPAAAAELEDQVYSTGVYLAGKTKVSFCFRIRQKKKVCFRHEQVYT